MEDEDELGNLDPLDITEDDPSEVVTFDPKIFDRENGAFVDTVGLMQHIKNQHGMLIGCDTGLLNLAAAVKESRSDKPSTFAILNQQADFRWGTEKGRRRWHIANGVEAFQCSKQGNWEEPLGQVRKEVEERAKELATKK